MSVSVQQKKHRFRTIARNIYMDKSLEAYLEQEVDRTASMYPEEVAANLANVIDRSFASVAYHNPANFVEYGDYRILDVIVRQIDTDWMYRRKSNPHIVVLYGPPGTGKTTWVRNAVAKYMISGDTLHGIYLEVTPGDFSSKFAGVPVAFLKTLIEVVSTADFPSVLLFDEADGILLKPREASGGIEIEQHRLVSEFKSALSILLSMDYPLAVIFTTNYKDTIVRADPALADRVTAWIEVPPPPNWARIAMAKKLLPPVFRRIWEVSPPILQANALRALKSGAEPPTLNSVWSRNQYISIKMPWLIPVMPFEADYLIGYLVAWGWNPLEKDLADALTLDFSRAVALWDEDNPLLKVYARGILSEMEMMRRFEEGKHKIEKSFLRTFHSARRGVDEFEKILTISYKPFWFDVLSDYNEKMLGERAKDSIEWKRNQLVCSLMVHGVPPSLLHHSISKCTPSRDFINIVNQVLNTGGIVTNAIRHIYLPFLASYSEDPMVRFIELRKRIGMYNKLLYRELREGRILEPIRIMLMEKDLEKAWSEAKKSLDGLDSEMRPYIGAALAVAKMLHKAIHTVDLEAKGIALFETYGNPSALIDIVIKIADELGVKEWLYVVLDPEAFPLGGIGVYNPESWRVFDPTFFNNDIASDTYGTATYTVAPIIERMGMYTVNITKRVMKEEEMLKNQQNVAS
ncbi:MAG: ATP-binding protein [Desulfurococcaceae archaeon]